MRKFLAFIFILLSINAFSQPPLTPSQTNEFCPLTYHTFSFTQNISTITGYSVTVTSGSATSSNLHYSTSGGVTTFYFDLYFNDNPNRVVISVSWTSGGSTTSASYTFDKIKSVGADRIPNGFSVSSNTAPICNNSGITVSFTKQKYKNTTTNVEFADINDYQYSLPAGWKLSGGSVSTGQTDHKVGSNSVTIIPDLLTPTGVVQVRSKGDCANTTNVSNWATINITRPTMSLLQNGSSNMTMRCGETGAKTFTVQNAPTSPSCITYTWKVANKGWSTTLGGAVQTTNIVNSNSSITLYSADNNSAPPQSVEVQMDAPDGSSVTKLVTVTYNAPSATLTVPLNQPMNCLDQTVDATLYFLPLNSYSLVWNTTSGDLINGNTPPQTNVGNSVTVTRQNTGSTITQTTLTIQASCGNIVSNIMEKEDCAAWADYSTTSFTVPDGCNDMLRADVEPQDEALEYDWYAYYLGSYHHLGNTYFPEIDVNFCACADEIRST